MRVRNTDYQARVWPGLRNPTTQTTLALQPGEEVDIELPQGFHDPYLSAVRGKAPKEVVTQKAADPAEED